MIELPVVTTKRLVLRPLTRKDAQYIYAYARHPDVGPNAGWKPHTSIKDTYDFIDYAITKRKLNQPGVWAIWLKDTEKVIGTIEIHSYQGYKGEIGFVLNPAYWKQGYITEAATAVIIYGFEHLNISRLAYAHFLFNEASARVREKLGFKVEGMKRKGFLHADGRILDEIISSLTEEDYREAYETRYKPFKAHCHFSMPNTL